MIFRHKFRAICPLHVVNRFEPCNQMEKPFLINGSCVAYVDGRRGNDICVGSWGGNDENVSIFLSHCFDVIAELKSLKRGRVRIGANESTSLYLLPHLILDYRALHPNVMVEIFRHVSERLRCL